MNAAKGKGKGKVVKNDKATVPDEVVMDTITTHIKATIHGKDIYSHVQSELHGRIVHIVTDIEGTVYTVPEVEFIQLFRNI